MVGNVRNMIGVVGRGTQTRDEAAQVAIADGAASFAELNHFAVHRFELLVSELDPNCLAAALDGVAS